MRRKVSHAKKYPLLFNGAIDMSSEVMFQITYPQSCRTLLRMNWAASLKRLTKWKEWKMS